MWLIDLEKTCSLLIGQCLGCLLIGEPQHEEEQFCRNWLRNPIFSNGLDEDACDIDNIYQISCLVISNVFDQILSHISDLSPNNQSSCKMALKLPIQYDEACAVQDDEIDFYDYMMENAGIESWDIEDRDGHLLDLVVRCFLITVLKHFGLLKKPVNHSSVREVYRFALNLRQNLLNSVCNVKYQNFDATDLKDDGQSLDSSEDTIELNYSWDSDHYKFYNFCKYILQRCLYVLLCVKGKYNK